MGFRGCSPDTVPSLGTAIVRVAEPGSQPQHPRKEKGMRNARHVASF